MKYGNWTPEEAEEATRMRAQGHSFMHIDKVLDRHRGAACKRYARCGQSFYQAEAQIGPGGVLVPLAVMEERDRAVQIGPSSVTAFICGDPLPGRSALDRRTA